MKLLFNILIMLFTSAQASEFCPIQSQGDKIAKLAKELEAACDWSIRKLAEEKILSDCSKAKNKDSTIRFRENYGKPTLVFSKFGDTYDHSEASIECKHSKAYKVKLNHLIDQYTHEAYTAQRNRPPKRDSSQSKSSKPQVEISKYNSPPPRDEPKLWRCQVPNYIRTYRIVNDGEKFSLENAHGNVCVEYRR